jgi:hypothetical protein
LPIISYAQSSSQAKGWQFKGKGKEKDKFMRKASKQSAKIKRENRKMAGKQKSRGKQKVSNVWKHDDKVKGLKEKEEGYVYKGRSKRHVKVQSKKTKRRMKKSLKKHRKLKR